MNKFVLVSLAFVLLVGCTATQPAASQVTTQVKAQTAAQPVSMRATVALTAAPSATVSSRLATVTPQATATLAKPTATAATAATSVAAAQFQVASASSGQVSGVLLSLSSTKYPAPTLLAPEDKATYNVSQPVAHLAWSSTFADLLTFGQTAACVSDATNFRRAFESYRLVIHSVDAAQPDQVQWTENNPSFDLNLTTVPQGRYTWSVDVVTLCESYVVGQRNSTITRSLVGAVSPASAARSINWVP